MGWLDAGVPVRLLAPAHAQRQPAGPCLGCLPRLACKGGSVPGHGRAWTLGRAGLCYLWAVHPEGPTCQHLLLGHLATVPSITWNSLAGSAECWAASRTQLEERQLPSVALGCPCGTTSLSSSHGSYAAHQVGAAVDVSCPRCAQPCHAPCARHHW